MTTKLTWWILAVFFVTSVKAVINVIANVCHIDESSIITSKWLRFRFYKTI